MDRLNRIWPPLLVIAAIVVLWWAVIVASGSLIFPSPQQVASGVLELAREGTLWEHIIASLVRVATGFLLALVVALPLGLWMGRVEGAYRTLNPVFQIMRPISPIAWI